MTKKDFTVTCGVIVTDTRGYLACHPTMSKWWDIPKGKMEEGETFGQTARRELQEETGIEITPDQLSFISVFDYKPDKKLALFYLQVDTMFDPTLMTCTSTFDRNGKTFLEMDKFKIVTKEELLEIVSPSMSKVLASIL